MTIQMPDSVTPGNIPMQLAKSAVLGYVDGLFPTAGRLPLLFPGSHVVALTVLGLTLEADGIDCEPGNVTAHRAAVWVHDKLEAEPGSRPVIYADLASLGYSMTEVLAELAALGVGRDEVRLLTAHYTGEAHICEASVCGGRDADGNLIAFRADGTQWTNSFPGVGGTAIDMSLLAGSFFGPSTGSTEINWTEKIMQDLPVLKEGGTGTHVKTVQFQCGEHGHGTPVDGAFGPATTTAVKAVQAMAGVAQDGIVGPVTWAKLLGV